MARLVVLIILIIAQCHAMLLGREHYFLKVPPYSRAIGLAEAYTSLSEGPAGLFYNPAGICDTKEFEADLSAILWLQGVKYVYAGIVAPNPIKGLGSLGLSFGWAGASQADSAGTGVPVSWPDLAGLSRIDNFSATAGISLPLIAKFLQIGANFKGIYETGSDGSSALNTGFDAGILLKFEMESMKMRLGGMASTRGYEIFTKNTGFEMPEKMSIGMANEFDFITGKLMITADSTFSNDSTALFKIGFEYKPFDALAIRAGYKIAAFNHPSAGITYSNGGLSLSYAGEFYETLGQVHALTMNLSWKAPPPSGGINVSPELFSTRKQRVRVKVSPDLKQKAGIKSLKVNIYREGSDKPVEVIRAGRRQTIAIEWDGRIGGRPAEEGVYEAEIETEYADGAVTRSGRQKMEVDNSPPKAVISASPKAPRKKPGEYTLLIPAVFGIRAEDRSGVDGWELIVRDHKKRIFFSRKGDGPPPARLIWDGKNNEGQYAKTGRVYYYSIRVKDALGNESETSPAEQVVVIKEMRMTLSSDTLFKSGKSEVIISAYKSVKKTLKDAFYNDNTEITVTGHTDSKESPGKYGSREELSLARAKAVKYFMVNLMGLTGHEIRTEGKGDTEPVSPNDTEKNRSKNRRVEVVIKSLAYK